MNYWPYVALIGLVICSAFFSGSEIAYSTANRNRLKKDAETGSRKHKLTLYLFEHYDNVLSAILIGNNLVNIAASSLATVLALQLLSGKVPGSVAAAIATLVITVLILIFGEITPKIIARNKSERVAQLAAIPLRILMILLTPVIFLVVSLVKAISKLWGKDEHQDGSLTEEELATVIETVEDEGVIDEERSELLQSALEFSDITAQEILTPRVDMLAIDLDDDMPTIIAAALESSHSRLPVYQKSPDNIVGILVVNHFFRAMVDQGEDVDIRSLLIEPCFIHKGMKLPAILAELKKRKTHIAIVTDEYGGTMGVLTMEDVLEQLVGDIWDENDVIVDEFVATGENTYEVNGDMNVSDFFEEMEMEDPTQEEDYSTIGSWAIEMLHGFPNPGDHFDFENLTITVKEINDLRITKLSVVAHPVEEE